MTALLPHTICGQIYILETEVTGQAQLSTQITVAATSHYTTELVSYPKHFSKLGHNLRDWRIVIDVSKSFPLLFINTERRTCFFNNAGQYSFLGTQYFVSRQLGILAYYSRYTAHLVETRNAGRTKEKLRD